MPNFYRYPYYRNALPPTPPKKPAQKKFNFKSFKKDTCKSLNDVECFLNNFSDTLKYIKLINLLK